MRSAQATTRIIWRKPASWIAPWLMAAAGVVLLVDWMAVGGTPLPGRFYAIAARSMRETSWMVWVTSVG